MTDRPPPGSSEGMLRILIAARWYPAFDDPARGSFVADQASALRAAGHDVVVASWEYARSNPAAVPAGSLTPAAWLNAISAGGQLATPRSWGAPGVPVARLPVVAVQGTGRASDPLVAVTAQAETLSVFVRWLDREWPIDVIHAHTGVPDGIAAARVAEDLGVRLVVTEHESGLERLVDDPAIRAAYRRLVGRATVIAVSRSLRDRISRALAVDAASVEVVPNVIDAAEFDGTDRVERDPTELLYVGARKATKGIDLLLETVALLAAEDSAVHLRLIGRAPGPAEELRLRARAEELGIADRVRFDQPADRPGIARAMARAGVFVHPSPSETFGVVAAEALAAGLPVAATPSGGVDEILGHGGTLGVVARGHDPEALAEAIREVRTRASTFDPERLRAAVAEYAPGAVAARLVALYRRTGVTRDPGSARAGAALAVDRENDGCLVVGLRRVTAARRLALIPPEFSATLVVVTEAARIGSNPATELPGPARWIEVDPDRLFRDERARLGGPLADRPLIARIARAARHPVRAIRLRRLGARRIALRAASIRAGLTAGLHAVAATRPANEARPIEVLALDADDVAAAQPLLGPEVVLMGTTLRGLLDRWDARGLSPVARSPVESEVRAADLVE